MEFMRDLPELLPVIVLVHEAWHTPTHYCNLIDSITALGYAIACPRLLTAHTESNCVASFHDDVSLIYQLVFDLASDGNDVIVIGHGYGAFVATEALGDLSNRERKRFGKDGGVVGLVTLAGLLPDQGEALKDLFVTAGQGEWPDFIRNQDASLVLLQPSTYLYNDLGAMNREHWTAHLVRFAANPSDIVCSSMPAWKTIPTTYIVCEGDRFLPESVQREMASKSRAQVIEIEDAGHNAFIGKTKDVVEALCAVIARSYIFGDNVVETTKSEPDDNAGDDLMSRSLKRTTTA